MGSEIAKLRGWLPDACLLPAAAAPLQATGWPGNLSDQSLCLSSSLMSWSFTKVSSSAAASGPCTAKPSSLNLISCLAMYKIMMHSNAKITCNVRRRIKEACCSAQPQAEAVLPDARASILRHRPPNASLLLQGGEESQWHHQEQAPWAASLFCLLNLFCKMQPRSKYLPVNS